MDGKWIAELREQIAYLKGLSQTDFQKWFEGAVFCGEWRPILPGSQDRRSVSDGWFFDRDLWGFGGLKEELSLAVSATMKQLVLDGSKCDKGMWTLLTLIYNKNIKESYSHLLELAEQNDYRDVTCEDTRGVSRRFYWLLCGTFIRTAPQDDERLRALCMRRIEEESPDLPVFYAILANKFTDSPRYAVEYFPQRVAFARTRPGGGYDLNAALHLHVFKIPDNRDHFLNNLTAALSPLAHEELDFLTREISLKRNGYEKSVAKKSEEGEMDFPTFAEALLDESRRIVKEEPSHPGEGVDVRNRRHSPHF